MWPFVFIVAMLINMLYWREIVEEVFLNIYAIGHLSVNAFSQILSNG